MSQYRKRPIVIEARQFTGPADGPRLARWCHGRFSHAAGQPFIVVRTLKGESIAWPGDWILHGTEGEFYPVVPAVFDAVYELAGAAS